MSVNPIPLQACCHECTDHVGHIDYGEAVDDKGCEICCKCGRTLL